MHHLQRLLVLVLVLSPTTLLGQDTSQPDHNPFAREEIVAWCIVPFDNQDRTPQARAEMLNRLGVRKLAYDYREKHIPTFDEELKQLQAHDIELTAWWFPTVLNDEAKLILAALKRHHVRTQLWVTGEGAPTTSEAEQQARIDQEVARLRPIVEAAAVQGCSVGLYNHGGWFGEPNNLVALVQAMQKPNVGIVYNLHHAHGRLDTFEADLALMAPYLMVLNLNGTFTNGEAIGKKIAPIGSGDWDASLLQIVQRSPYHGPIGILNHTQVDAEQRLLDNLDGMEWLLQRLQGNSVPPPKYRTSEESPRFVPPVAALSREESATVDAVLDSYLQHGQVSRGAKVFASAKSACLSCHRVGEVGGHVGPDLGQIGQQRTARQVIESLLWPNRQVETKYQAEQFILSDGSTVRGIVQQETESEIVLREAHQTAETRLVKEEVEARRPAMSLMPEGLMQSLSTSQQVDLVAFLMDLGKHEKLRLELVQSVLSHAQSHEPTPFPYVRDPLRPSDWPHWEAYVNRDRVYDFYTKEADFFRQIENPPSLLAEYPELDGGKYGHWGNQNEQTWANSDWNQTDLGTMISGVFHGKDGKVVPRAVCLRVGEGLAYSLCYNLDSQQIESFWQDGFIEFSSVRHGLLDGLIQKGKLLEVPPGVRLARTASREYVGLYRVGKRVVFAFREGETIYLDAPWVEQGRLVREVAAWDQHSMRDAIAASRPQWPQVIETELTFGKQSPYAVDTIALPWDNPWRALMYCGDHDFMPDGSAMVCTIQGDVWHVSGLQNDPAGTQGSAQVRWRRFASGLHQPLGLLIDRDGIFVLGRDQLTRLNDLNRDGEADYYECYSRAYETSPAGHDYICGLQRDARGNFYTASSNQGLVQIQADGKAIRSLAEGFRNPDGLGLYPDGIVTVPCSEGDWTPASMLCAVRVDEKPSEPLPFFGHRGSRFSKRPIEMPRLPMVYFPRGVDNSAGGQVYVTSDRWGPLKDQLVHCSFGTGSHMLILRDEVEGQLQGAVVPLPGEFLSGVHRGRFSPQDGQLYVSGMAGWGTYTPEMGCFHRVRYTGADVQLPIGIHSHRNGITLRFSQPLDRQVAEQAASHFAQAWNYRYSAAYGSREYSSQHYGARGHDRLEIRSSHVLEDGRTLFLEIPELQPVEQLHLQVAVDGERRIDLFATCHRLDRDRDDFPGYRPGEKALAMHPLELDMKLVVQRVPNPWSAVVEGSRTVRLETGKNLSYLTPKWTAKVGERLHLRLVNPDAVPHNWALIRPGSLERVGAEANRLVADPEALIRQYVPQTDDVLCYTDIVEPGSETSIYFQAPDVPGVYPFLCTFPGHWMVMNGQLIVEAK